MVVLLVCAISGVASGEDDGPPSDQPWVPWPLEGPYEALAEVCADVHPKLSCAERTGLGPYDQDTCALGDDGCEAATGPSHAARRTGAIRQVQVFRIGDGCHLGIRTVDGWYVSEEIELCRNSGTGRVTMRSLELSIRDVTRGPRREVYFRYAVQDLHHIDGGSRSHATIVCGVGASGVPSCTRPMRTWWMTLVWGDPVRDEIPVDSGYVRLRFGGRGMRARHVRGTISRSQQRMIGEHELVFP